MRAFLSPPLIVVISCLSQAYVKADTAPIKATNNAAGGHSSKYQVPSRMDANDKNMGIACSFVVKKSGEGSTKEYVCSAPFEPTEITGDFHPTNVKTELVNVDYNVSNTPEAEAARNADPTFSLKVEFDKLNLKANLEMANKLKTIILNNPRKFRMLLDENQMTEEVEDSQYTSTTGTINISANGMEIVDKKETKYLVKMARKTIPFSKLVIQDRENGAEKPLEEFLKQFDINGELIKKS